MWFSNRRAKQRRSFQLNSSSVSENHERVGSLSDDQHDDDYTNRGCLEPPADNCWRSRHNSSASTEAVFSEKSDDRTDGQNVTEPETLLERSGDDFAEADETLKSKRPARHSIRFRPYE